MFKYSEKLIQKTIIVFKEEDGIDISEKTACEYLENLGSLFLSFRNENKLKNNEVMN